MKCDDAEQAMLLEQSGELNPFRQWRLHAHRAHCEHCRQFHADLLRITNDAKAWMPGAELSGAALKAIRDAAGREDARRDNYEIAVRLRPFAIGQVVALAAALVLVVFAGWMTMLRSSPTSSPAPQTQEATAPSESLAWDDDFDNAIAEVGTILTMASDDTESNGNGTGSPENTDVESLARELLQLEGSQI